MPTHNDRQPTSKKKSNLRFQNKKLSRAMHKIRRRKAVPIGTETVDEKSTLTLAWRFLEVLAAGVAVWALIISIQANEHAQEANAQAQQALSESQKQSTIALQSLELSMAQTERSRVVDAWQILANRATGNSGKREALQFLHQSGQALDGVDLSCETMGGQTNWNIKKQRCFRPTYLESLTFSDKGGDLAQLGAANFSGSDLGQSDFGRANLVASVFDGAILSGANFGSTIISRSSFDFVLARGANFSRTVAGSASFRNAFLMEANFERTIASSSDFSGAALQRAVFTGANLTGANLSFAILGGARLEESDLNGANISGTDFCKSSINDDPCASGVTQELIAETWAFDDYPPLLGEASFVGSVTLCPNSLRNKWILAGSKGRPEGC